MIGSSRKSLRCRGLRLHRPPPIALSPFIPTTYVNYLPPTTTPYSQRIYIDKRNIIWYNRLRAAPNRCTCVQVYGSSGVQATSVHVSSPNCPHRPRYHSQPNLTVLSFPNSTHRRLCNSQPNSPILFKFDLTNDDIDTIIDVCRRSPIGRDNGLKIRPVWVRVPPVVLGVQQNYVFMCFICEIAALTKTHLYSIKLCFGCFIRESTAWTKTLIWPCS